MASCASSRCCSCGDATKLGIFYTWNSKNGAIRIYLRYTEVSGLGSPALFDTDITSCCFPMRFSCLVCLSVGWCVAFFSLLLICGLIPLLLCLFASVFSRQSLERMFGTSGLKPSYNFAGEFS